MQMEERRENAGTKEALSLLWEMAHANKINGESLKHGHARVQTMRLGEREKKTNAIYRWAKSKHSLDYLCKIWSTVRESMLFRSATTRKTWSKFHCSNPSATKANISWPTLGPPQTPRILSTEDATVQHDAVGRDPWEDLVRSRGSSHG